MLTALPQDLLLQLLSYCDLNDILRLEVVSRMKFSYKSLRSTLISTIEDMYNYTSRDRCAYSLAISDAQAEPALCSRLAAKHEH